MIRLCLDMIYGYLWYRVQNGSTARWHTMALSKWHGYGCQNYDFPNMISDPV